MFSSQSNKKKKDLFFKLSLKMCNIYDPSRIWLEHVSSVPYESFSSSSTSPERAHWLHQRVSQKTHYLPPSNFNGDPTSLGLVYVVAWQGPGTISDHADDCRSSSPPSSWPACSLRSDDDITGIIFQCTSAHYPYLWPKTTYVQNSVRKWPASWLHC